MKSSRYAEKVKRGQMYGPGCCANRLTNEQVQQRKAQLREQGVRMPAIPYSFRDGGLSQ